MIKAKGEGKKTRYQYLKTKDSQGNAVWKAVNQYDANDIVDIGMPVVYAEGIFEDPRTKEKYRVICLGKVNRRYRISFSIG